MFLLCGAAAVDSSFAESTVKSANVTAVLVSEASAIQPGKPFTVALQMKMAPGWHIYWKNPGDSGRPTQVVWTLPDSFKASELQWPTPARTIDGGLALYGYEHQATFLTDITPSPSLPPGKFTVAANVTWLECKNVCIPGKASLDLTLPAATTTAARPIPTAEKAAFTKARAAMPQASSVLKGAAAVRGTQFILKLSGLRTLAAPLEFFPDTANLIEPAAPQTVSRNGATWEIHAKRPTNADALPEPLIGVLVSGTGTAKRSYKLIAHGAR